YSEPTLAHSPGRASIAHPAPNQRMYLLDANLQPVPIGVPGDLYVAGESLASGYIAAAPTQPTPMAIQRLPAKAGEMLFKTGDRGRFLAGGGIELIARTEDLEKTNGFRLELCEIRSVINDHPGVWDTFLLARQECEGV